MSHYESHNLEDQALPFIYKERTVRPTGRPRASSNWHENIELLYIVQGAGTVSNNGRVLPVVAGNIVMINANHLHDLSASDQPLVHRYLIVDRTFCLANGLDTNTLAFDMQIHDERVHMLMEALHEAYTRPPESPFYTLSIRALVLELLVLLCRDHSTPAPQDERHERSVSYIKAAIDYIRASFDKDFSLEDVAAFVGVNKCYLSREFHKYTGYPFIAYVNLTRCKMAQRRLRDTDLGIHEVARQCGFANRSYFARSFARYIGMLPGEYRASLQQAPKNSQFSENCRKQGANSAIIKEPKTKKEQL